MTKEEALIESINHWMRLATGQSNPNEWIGALHCPLCKLYNFQRPGKRRCKDCPVDQVTGEPYCLETPYMRVKEYVDKRREKLTQESMEISKETGKSYDDITKDLIKEDPYFQHLASLELNFLRYVLISCKKEGFFESVYHNKGDSNAKA